MPTISIKANFAEVSRFLNGRVLKQLEFAKMVAVNRTAKRVREGTQKVMAARFDRPTPYTMNSLWVDNAKKGQAAEARVRFKDDAGKGTPATKYLTPEVYGGVRRPKRFENALIRSGHMKAGEYAVPGAGARLDAYGNMSKGQIVQVLSALKAHGEQGYTANRTRSKRSQKAGAKSRYFVMRGQGAGEGIWHRQTTGQGGKIVPVLLFTPRAPSYRVRVPFEKIADNIAKAHLKAEFDRAFNEAMASAK